MRVPVCVCVSNQRKPGPESPLASVSGEQCKYTWTGRRKPEPNREIGHRSNLPALARMQFSRRQSFDFCFYPRAGQGAPQRNKWRLTHDGQNLYLYLDTDSELSGSSVGHPAQPLPWTTSFHHTFHIVSIFLILNETGNECLPHLIICKVFHFAMKRTTEFDDIDIYGKPTRCWSGLSVGHTLTYV